MGKKDDKTRSFQSRPFSNLQNFSDYIEAERTTIGEDDPDIQIKGTGIDTSKSAYPTDKIPIQIRRSQLYKEAHKNLQLKPSYVQWLCTDQCRFHCDHCDMGISGPSLDGLTNQEMIKALDTLTSLGCDAFSVIGVDPCPYRVYLSGGCKASAQVCFGNLCHIDPFFERNIQYASIPKI